MKLVAAFLLLFTLNTPSLAANDHYRNGDLLSVHWDSSYDYDDLQAMPATREILDAYPGTNYLVINGAKSNANSGIVEGSSDVMRMVFPDGLDAFNNKNNSKHLAADRWQAVLQAGRTVHVAEGGPSDFTADIIRELQSRNVGNLKNIRVIQHSFWNERHTSDTNLALVKSVTSYLKIEDGNGVNKTAWLRSHENQSSAFRNLTSRSQHSHVWELAFQSVTDPARFVDFSDTVEVLYILDVPKSRVADAFDFGNVFFGKSGDQAVVPSEPGVPSEPTVPATSEDRVAVYGSDLAVAMRAYAQATTLRRADCDPSGSGYICASFPNPTAADLASLPGPTEPVTPVEPVDPVTPAEPAPALPVITEGRVAVYASNLAAARRAYAAATTLRRADCDPSGSGYVCASFQNPTIADIQPVAAPIEEVPAEPTEPSVPAEPSVPVIADGRVAVYGDNLTSARTAYANATTLRRVDCDPVAGGYVCASFSNPTLADVDAPAQAPQPTAPDVPDVSVPPAPSGSTSSYRFEVENYNLGDGWVKDTNRAGYSGSGYIRWTGSNLYNINQAGEGVMRFVVTPDVSGEYAVRLRSRAINPAASDLSNDVWMRLDGAAWLKVYNAGKDEWIVGGAVDSNHQHYVLKKTLIAGNQHVLEISGRSNGFAIDYIELIRQ